MAYAEFTGELDSAPAKFVPFDGNLDPSPNRGPATIDDPLTRVSPSSSGDNPTFTVSAPPSAGQGRGFVNPPLVGEAKPEAIGQTAGRMATNAGRSVMAGFAKLGEGSAMVTGGAAVLADKLHSVFSGKEETGLGDWVFGNSVDPAVQAQKYWAPTAEEAPGVADKIINGLAGMAPTLLIAGATGGGVAAPSATVMGLPAAKEALLHGMKTMSVAAFNSGLTRSAELVREGAPLAEAVRSGLIDAASTDLTGGVAMSVPGASLAARALQGAAVGATTGEVGRQAQNLALSEDRQVPFSMENLAVEAGTGAALGATMAHSATRVPSRADLGYEHSPNIIAEHYGELDPVAQIVRTKSVDEAIYAANEAANAPTSSVAEEMRAIRPLAKPTERADVSKPVGDAGEPAGGVPSRGTVDARSQQPGELLPDAARRTAYSSEVAAPDSSEAMVLGSSGEHQGPVEKPAFAVSENPSGTVTVRGDVAAIKERLAEFGINKAVPTKDGMLIGRSQAEQAKTLFSQEARPQAEAARLAETAPMFSRSERGIEDEHTGVSSALLELGRSKDLFQYPVSDAKSMDEIAKSKRLKVSDVNRNSPDNKLWMLANSTPHDGPGVKSWIVDLQNGKHATITDKNGEVYINVSSVGEGNRGSRVYDLAANYAHNNDKVFIGDPNGVSPAAMRRRLENMLSSAVKYGTTDHLKPHPDQYLGDAAIGVPPLDWTNGDTLGNIRSMVDTSIAATDASHPIATSNVRFDPETQSFYDGENKRLDAGRLADYLSDVRKFDGRTPGAGQAGNSTLRRSALFKSLLSSVGARRALLDSVHRQRDRGGSGVGSSLEKSFYSRGDGKGLSEQDGRRAVESLRNAGLGDVRIVDGLSDLPETARQKIASEGETGVRGVYDPATKSIWLVRDKLSSVEDAFFVGMHEAFHRGLRETFGPEVEPILNLIHDSNQRVRLLAEQYRMRYKIGRMEAIEEVLADLAGKNKVGDLKGWDTLVSFLRSAMQKIADSMGVKVNLSDKQVMDFVAGVRRAGMKDEVHLERGTNEFMASRKDVVGKFQGARSILDNLLSNESSASNSDDASSRTVQVDGKPRPTENSNGKPIHPTEDGIRNFWHWLGDSKLVDEQGRPLVVYHGTDADFTAFDTTKAGIRQYSDWGQGIYLTPSESNADYYRIESAKKVDAEYNAAFEKYEELTKDVKTVNGAPQYSEEANAALSEFQRIGREKNKSSAGKVMELYASINNPLIQEYSSMPDPFLAERAKKKGHDGILVLHPSGSVDEIVAFRPDQIKSATGNRGEFDGRSPNIRFSRIKAAEGEDTAPEEDKPYAGPGAKMLDGAKNAFGSVRDDLLNHIAPMSTGSQKAKASAQQFANDSRVARYQWQKMSTLIKARFNASERKEMWDAADEQNTLMQQGKPTDDKGLDRLNAKQRDVMQTLHEYANQLWERAQEAGLVSGGGLPFWTPRMAVMVGEDGSFSKPGGDGKTATSSGVGRNVMTSAPSAKHRKYVETAESEAALKAKKGDSAEYVHDILTMPLAMSRFEQAIAGRELINQVKEIGLATGQETVSSAGGPNFFTLDHPAFTSFKPRMVTDADGKTTPAKDQNGDMIFDKTPIFISKDFYGPLKSVMSTTDGVVYSGYMLLKSKAMTAIMASPLTHNMVIYGRALAYSPAQVGTGYLYWKGHALAKDDALMRSAIGHGLVPIGANKNSMMDITDVARGIGRQGSWGDPNESWVSLSLQKLGNALSDGTGDKIKEKVDALGDFVHHTLLWKQVGALQIGIYSDMYQYLAAKGYSDKAAGPVSAHIANRYAGAVAQENMSEIARKTANVLLFSRSFNMGNLGAMKDTMFGMPEGLKAKMMEDVGGLEGKRAISYAQRKAVAGLLTEVGISVVALSVVQSAVDRMKKDKSWDEIGQGYLRRLNSMVENIGQHPFNPESYNPYKISGTFDNEPGKEDRIDMGEQPGGRHEYMRLPTGKVVEDMIGWALNPGDTFSKKMSPMSKAVWQNFNNDKGFGIPVKDPEGGFYKHVYDLATHVAEAQLPWDSIKNLYDLSQGKATAMDKDKLAGFATGFSYSQGHPGGPEAAVAAKTEERVQVSKKYTMELVKRDLKYGDSDKAADRLEAIGFTPREISTIIKRAEEPTSNISRQAMKKFNRHATEDERKQMDSQR